MTVTVIDLEFDTGAAGRAPLGDIAASLVSIDELLRDLAAIAAYPSTAEFRQIQVAGITMRQPLTVRLSLQAIPIEAVKAFQEICRDIILCRERRSSQVSAAASGEDPNARRLSAAIEAALTLCVLPDQDARITEQEAQRLFANALTLENAEVPLKLVVVKEE